MWLPAADLLLNSFIRVTVQVAPGVNLTSNLGKLLLSDTFKFCSQIELKVSKNLLHSFSLVIGGRQCLYIKVISGFDSSIDATGWSSVVNIDHNGLLFHVASFLDIDSQIFIAS